MLAVTLDAGIAGEHVADPLQRFFGVALLDMTDQGVNHRHAEDHQGIDPVPHDGGQRRGGQQHVNQYVVKVGEKAQPARFAFLSGSAFGPQVFRRSAASAELNPAAWLLVCASTASTVCCQTCRGAVSPEGVVNFGLFILVNLHFPYKFRESESLKSFLANEVKEGKNADKNVNQYKSKFFAK